MTDGVGTSNSDFREEWLKNALSEIPEGLKILDAGAGESQYKKFCDHLEYISQDFAEYDGVGDSKGIQKENRDYSSLDIVSDITSIPVSDNAFDVVMCIEVLEHVPNPVDALTELNRVLKPGEINPNCSICKPNSLLSLPLRNRIQQVFLRTPFERIKAQVS